MKKILLSFIAFTSLTVNAQFIDTLNEHFSAASTIHANEITDGGFGFITGSNSFKDLAKMQLFDPTYGVASAGVITNVLLSIPFKSDGNGNGGSFSVTLWTNESGAATQELASETIALADLDTAIASIKFFSGGFYNVNVVFDPPIEIPDNKSFWAGVELPTADDDMIYITSNSDGDFLDADTHTGEIWEDGTFTYIGDDSDEFHWGRNISMAIFPVVNMISASLHENSLEASIYPNPTTDRLNFQLNSVASSVEILSVDGKTLITSSVNENSGSVDVSTLEPGFYTYRIKGKNGAESTSTFVKK